MASAVLHRLSQSNALAKLRAGTNFMFNKHLLVTNIMISTSLSGVGDFLQQHYEILKSTERTYNPKRTFNMGVTGLTIGILCHNWYNWLDKFMPGRTLANVCKKVIIDQLICSPATIGTFFVTLAIIEKSSADEFLAEFKEKSWRLYLAEWVIWPPAQMINFYILPTKYRVLYDNTISLGYDVYTSYVYNELPTPSSSTSEPSTKVPPKHESESETPTSILTLENTEISDGL